jgi:hypothetical protein
LEEASSGAVKREIKYATKLGAKSRGSELNIVRLLNVVHEGEAGDSVELRCTISNTHIVHA